MGYVFNTDWFNVSMLYNDIIKNRRNYDKITHNILEIGCYEGRSSCFFSDNLLNNSGSTMDCVDPFLHDTNNDHNDWLLNNEEARFDANIKQSKFFDKITTHKITSDEFFLNNKKMFNFIFIDGCHKLDCVEKDLQNAYNSLTINGVIWMDDYGGGVNFRDFVDDFIIKNNCEIIQKGYQIAFIKK